MSEGKIKISDFVKYITQHMSAEEALTKLLATQINHYEKLKLEKQPEDNPETVSPYLIMTLAAFDLGWLLSVEDEKKSSVIRGLSMGSEEYLKELFHTPNVTPEDLGGLLFGIHNHHPENEKVIYYEEDIINLLKLFKFPEPVWGKVIKLEDYGKEISNAGGQEGENTSGDS